MTWSEHWSVLLSGSFASLISLVGVFVVFRLTVRHERLREDRRRQEEAASDEDARCRAAVTRVRASVVMQPKDLVLAPLFGHAQALELLNACVDLATVVGPRHPGVAIWTMEQHGRIVAARSRLWPVAWLPVVRKARLDAWSEELSKLGGRLSEWELGGLTDEWFESRVAPGR